MIDLTPLDVRKKRGDFSKGMRGYDPAEVDGFLDIVAERLEALVKENLTLRERSDRLGDQVRSQEGRERAVQEALVTAQELREDILGQARREADLLQREAEGKAEETRRIIDSEAEELRRTAQAEADRVVEGARTHLAELQESIQELERRRVRFLKSFRSLLERELGDVEVEEMRAPMEVETLEIDLHGARRTPGPDAGEADTGEGAPAAEAQEAGEGAPAAEAQEAGEAQEEDDTAGDSDDPPIVDVADVAPDAEPAEAEGADSGGSWTTATLVYDENPTGPEDDATVRGA